VPLVCSADSVLCQCYVVSIKVVEYQARDCRGSKSSPGGAFGEDMVALPISERRIMHGNVDKHWCLGGGDNCPKGEGGG